MDDLVLSHNMMGHSHSLCFASDLDPLIFIFQNVPIHVEKQRFQASGLA
jgi:hypothetical protein